MTESIHFLAGAYVVDALDDVERADFEEHLAGCADCQSEVASLSEGAAVLADAVSIAPPPGLRDRVLADIATVRPLPPLEEQHDTTPGVPATTEHPGATVTPLAPRRRRGFALLAAAAAVVAAVGVGAVWQPWDDGGPGQSPAQLVMAAPDAERVSLEFDGGARATVVHSDELAKSVIITEKMPPPPEGKVYQVWLNMPDDGMVSAAVMPIKEDQTVLLEGDAAKAVGAGITVEPEGGSTEPTTAPIALFEFDSA
ncbi:anti-sigma factor [Nocardioides pacificus]